MAKITPEKTQKVNRKQTTGLRIDTLNLVNYLKLYVDIKNTKMKKIKYTTHKKN